MSLLYIFAVLGASEAAARPAVVSKPAHSMRKPGAPSVPSIPRKLSHGDEIPGAGDMEKSYPDKYFDCFYIWLFFQCCQCCGCYGERSVLMRDKPAVVSRTQVDKDGDSNDGDERSQRR